MTYCIFSIRLLLFCCAASNPIWYCIFWFVLTLLCANLINIPYIYLSHKSSCPAFLLSYFSATYIHVALFPYHEWRLILGWLYCWFGKIIFLQCTVNIFLHDISIMTNVKNTLLWSVSHFFPLHFISILLHAAWSVTLYHFKVSSKFCYSQSNIHIDSQRCFSLHLMLHLQFMSELCVILRTVKYAWFSSLAWE